MKCNATKAAHREDNKLLFAAKKLRKQKAPFCSFIAGVARTRPFCCHNRLLLFCEFRFWAQNWVRSTQHNTYASTCIHTYNCTCSICIPPLGCNSHMLYICNSPPSTLPMLQPSQLQSHILTFYLAKSFSLPFACIVCICALAWQTFALFFTYMCFCLSCFPAPKNLFV